MWKERRHQRLFNKTEHPCEPNTTNKTTFTSFTSDTVLMPCSEDKDSKRAWNTLFAKSLWSNNKWYRIFIPFSGILIQISWLWFLASEQVDLSKGTLQKLKKIFHKFQLSRKTFRANVSTTNLNSSKSYFSKPVVILKQLSQPWNHKDTLHKPNLISTSFLPVPSLLFSLWHSTRSQSNTLFSGRGRIFKARVLTPGVPWKFRSSILQNRITWGNRDGHWAHHPVCIFHTEKLQSYLL